MSYVKGQRLSHTIFGKGTITDVTANTITIKFDEHGTKELQRGFCAGKITFLEDDKKGKK
jgi:hypothetical protein